VDVVAPSDEFLTLTQWGTNMLDQTLISDAVKLGNEQGAPLAPSLAQFWRD